MVLIIAAERKIGGHRHAYIIPTLCDQVVETRLLNISLYPSKGSEGRKCLVLEKPQVEIFQWAALISESRTV